MIRLRITISKVTSQYSQAYVFDPSAFACGSMMPASAPAAAMTVCMAAVASGPWWNHKWHKVTKRLSRMLPTLDKTLETLQRTYHKDIAIKKCNYCTCTGRYIARTHTQSTAIYPENSRASSCMQADITAEEFFVFRLARLAASFQGF